MRLFLTSAFLAILIVHAQNTALAQCGSLPAIVTLGSDKLPNSLCSPVTADLNYRITFASPMPAVIAPQLLFEWGDGTPTTIVNLTPGATVYNITRAHSFPTNSDCEYQVRMFIRTNNIPCSNTVQFQRIATWRTDAFNNGNVQLISPVTNTSVHEVCEGTNVNVILEDRTNFNCNAVYPVNYTPGGPFIENPNEQFRWQQIVYNTPIGGSKIPNVSVNGVPVTGAGGANIIANYQDTRGVFFMASPVVINDPRRRNTLSITAPGGIGPGFPVTGDEFEVTIRYWNICNPYDNPNVPGPPADPINGDFAPVERVALIRIIDSPDSPVVPNRDVCFVSGGNADELSVSSPLGGGFTYRWWSNASLTTQVATGTTFDPLNAQAPNGQRTHFWVTVESNAAGNCRSLPTEVRLTKRTALATPPAITVVGIPSNPSNFCPNTSYTFTVGTPPANVTITDPSPDPDVVLATDYIWTFPPGWIITSGQTTQTVVATSPTTAAASANISVVRQYETGTSTPPAASFCPSSPSVKSVTVRAAPTALITPDPAVVCATNPLQLNGNPTLAFGTITSHVWTGSNTILNNATIQQPNVLTSTPAGSYNLIYTVTAEFDPGVSCSGSDNITVVVDPNTLPSDAGPDQDQCGPPTFISAPMGASVATPGVGTWSIVSRPAGSTAVAATAFSNINNRNATFTGDIPGEYILRWTVVSGTTCISFDDASVEFGTDPGAQNAGSDNSFCGLSGSLSAVPPTVGNIVWSQVSGPGTTSFSNSAISNPTITPTLFGTYVYRITVTSGLCTPRTDDVQIVFNEPVTATAPANFTACVNNPPSFTIPITGTISGPVGSTGRWEVVAPATGTFVSSGTGTGAAAPLPNIADTYQPSVADFALASITLRLRALDPDVTGPCTDITGDVVITLDKQPTASNAGSSFSTCDATAVLNAIPANNAGIGTWSVGSPLYYETFPLSDNNLGIIGPPIHATTFTHPSNNWSVSVPANNTFTAAADWIKVDAGRMSAQDVNNAEVVWRSRIVTHTGTVTISVQATEIGNNGADGGYIQLFYVVDGGAETSLGNITGDLSVDGQIQTFSLNSIPVGTSIQVVARMRNNGATDQHILDNVIITAGGSSLPIITDVNNPSSAVSNLLVGANVFTWTVNSALGVCSSSISSVTITRNDLPVNNDPVPILCEDIPFGGPIDAAISLAYLNTLRDAITGIPGFIGRTVEFYVDAARTTPFPAAGTIAFETGEQVFTRVIRTDVTPNCSQNGVITFTINPLPVANNQLFAICEETVGSADKDNNNLIALFDLAVTGGLANRTVSWFLDPGVPVTSPGDLVIPVPGPTDVDDVTDGELFYGLITNTLTGCQNIARVEFDIRPRPSVNPIVGQATVCASSTFLFYQVTNLIPGSTYNWNLPPNGPGFQRFAGGGVNDFFVVLQFPSVVTPPNDTYLISVTETSPNPDACPGNTNNLTVTVESSPAPNPIIGNNLICKGDNSTYEVTNQNAGNTYSWSIASTPASDAAIIGASSGVNLFQVIVNFGNADQTVLEVVETSPTGCALPTAQTFTINAVNKPVMTSLPPTPICSDALVSSGLTLLASTDGGVTNNPAIEFDWQLINITGTVSNVSIGNTGTVSISQTPINTSGVNATLRYRVTPKTPLPNVCVGTALDYDIVVIPKPVLVVGQTKTVCSDVAINYKIQLTPPDQPSSAVLTWPDPDGIGPANSGTNVPATNALHLTDVLTNVSGGPQTLTYVVTPSNGLCVGTTQSIIININPEPVGAPLTILPNICSDGNINYALSGSITNGVPSNFLWRVLPAGDNANLTGQTTGAGSVLSTINDALTNISNPGTNQSIIYTVTPTGTAAVGNCVGDNFQVSITVEPKPQGALQNLSAICSSLTSPSPVGYTLQSAVINSVPSDFSWQAVSNTFVDGESFLAPVINDQITDIISNSSSPSNQRIVTYAVTPTSENGLACVGAPFTVNVPVNPEPVGANRTLTAICSDTPLLVAEADLQQTINSSGNGLQSTFQWQVLVPDNNTNVANQTLAPAIGITSTITDILHNVSGVNQNITYTVTPTTSALLGIGTCVGQPFRIEVVSKSEPVGFDDTDLVCSDLNPGYDIQLENVDDTGHAPPGNAQPSTFVWRPTLDNPDVTGDENLGNRFTNVIGETLINVTSGPEVVVYEVIPTGTNACLGETFDITVTVDPKPVGVSVTSASAPAIAVTDICSGSTFTYDIQNNINQGGNNVASNFEWAASSASLFINNEITAVTNTPVINNPNLENTSLPAANGTVVYTVTPRSVGGNCLGPQFTVEVVVKPLPKGSDQTLPEICTESTLAYSLQSSINAFSGVFPSNFVWRAQTDVTGMAGESLTNQTTPTLNDQLTITDLSPLQKTVVYEITPTGQAPNGCIGPVFEITVPVNPKPLGATFSESAPFTCSDVAHNVNLQSIVNTVNSVPSSFVWVATDNVNVAGENLSNQSGDFITDVINNKTSALSELVEYTVTPTSDLGSCVGPSFTVFTRTQPEPVGTSEAIDICSTDAVGYSLQNNINANNGLTSSFVWRAKANIVNVTGESLTNQFTNFINDALTNGSNPGVLQTVEYDVTPTYITGGCVGDLFTVTVNVIPRPTVSSTVMPNICSDVPFSLNPQVNVTNSVVSTFTWTALFNAPISPGSPAGSGIISESLENVGGTVATAVYTIQANNMVGVLNCAAQTTFTITQPIDPKPVTNPSLSSILPICSDLPLGMQARLSTNGISIPADSWDVFLVSKDTYLSGTPSQGASSPDTFIENDVFNNVTRNPGLVVYRVTPIGPAATFCRGSESLVRVRVDPEPVMNPALTAATIVCSDETLNIQLTTVPTAVDAASYIYRDLQDPITVSVAPSVGNAVPEPIETGIGDRPFTVIQNDKYTNTTNVSLFRTYVVKPKSSAGCLGNIQNIPIQILPEPTFTITAPPPICSGDALDLQLDPAPGSTSIGSYQVTNINWDIVPAPGLLPGGANIAIGSILAGSNVTINDTYTNGTNATLTATYRVFPIATTVAGKSCAGNEQNATVQIKPSPIVLDDLDEIVCSNAINGITINTKPTSAVANSYEITRDPLLPGLAPGVYAPGTTTLTGNSTNNIANDRLVNSANNAVPVVYRVRANTDATPATGCFGPEEQITVLVEPQFTVTLDGTTNMKPDICGGTDLTNIVLVSPSNPSAGTVTFDFTVSPSISGAVSGANFNEGDVIAQSLINTTNAPVVVTYTVTPEANSAAGGLGCLGVANITTVTIRPRPKLTASPATFTICEGEALGVDFATPTTAGTGAGLVLFELVRVEDPNNAPSPPANGVSGFNTTFPTSYAVGTDALNDVLANNNVDGLQHNIRYVLLPKFTIPTPTATCFGDESMVTVNVSPRAVLATPTNVEVCSGEEFTQNIIVQEADPSSTVITWTRIVSPSTGVTGSSNGAGDNITQVIFNNTNNIGTATYTFTPKSFNCVGPSQNLVATVQPAPKVDPLTTQRLCANDVLSISPIPSPTTGVSFRWTNDNTDPLVTGPASGVGNVINDAWSNISDGLAVITYEITPRVFKANSDACEGPAKFMTVNIAPPVNGNIFSATGDDDAFICDGDDELITFESTGLSKFQFTYEVDDGLTVTPFTRTNANSFVTINESPTRTTTYRLLSVTDAFGCVAPMLTGNTEVTVNVGRTDASFTVPGAVINCSPFPVDFQYNQVNGINYTWRWADSEPDSTYMATATVTSESVRHRFVNPSTSSTKNFKVELEASIPDDPDPDNIYPRGGCLTRTNRTVSVYPIVQSIISVDKTDICSGEQINFRNSSRGVNNDKWFYRVEGTTDQLDVRNGTYSGTQKPSAFTSFILDNAIVSPSINIEVVYQASNVFGCSAPDSITTIRVFRGPVADFDINNGPTQFNVVSTVDIVNTSTPMDAGNFTYQWDFGLDSQPETASGIGNVFNLTYTSPGLKEVTLVVTSNAGGCQDTQSKQFEIEVPPLSADFVATPLFACFPVEVTAESFAAGNVVEWELIDESGRTAATSSEPEPVFAITNPGKYTLRLTTYYETLPDNTASQIKDLEIYDLPRASFETRPTTVFIPDQEVRTFNFSTGANLFEWDFGDGNTSSAFEPEIKYRVEGEYPIQLVAGFDHGDKDVDGDGILDGNIICYDTLSRTVIAKDGGLTRVPNSFTPSPNGPNGGNGGSGSFNDTFLPITKGVEEFQMQIFDRWGNLVFESRDKNQGWDGYNRNGNLLPAGVYVYKLVLRLSNGERTTQVGDVTLIR